jgi:hypothetical protein
MCAILGTDTGTIKKRLITFFKDEKKKTVNVDKQSRRCRLGKPSGGGMLL